MTDEELIRSFEAGTLGPGEFTHAAHVRAAWWYLRSFPLLEATGRFIAALQRFAAVRGAPEKYHATITVAYLLLIAERLAEDGGLPWDEFAARYPELLTQQPPIVSRYYADETLRSERARRVFVMPELGTAITGKF